MTMTQRAVPWARRAATIGALATAGCGGGSTIDAPVAASAFRSVIAARPLAGTARVTASADGTTWLVWSEGDNASQSLVGAMVDAGGGIVVTTIAPAAGVLRDYQVVMVGTMPVVAWREYQSSGTIEVNSAAWVAGAWQRQLSESASAQGDVGLTSLGSTGATLAWTRVNIDDHFELVASRRGPTGAWSPPVVVRAGGTAKILLRSRLAIDTIDASGTQALVWSETTMTNGVPAPPQALWSSRQGPAGSAWDSPVLIDSGRLYDSPAVVPTGNGTWVTAWLDGNPIGATAVLSKRFVAGAWAPDTTRLDRDRGETLRELAIGGQRGGADVAWTSVAPDQGSVFAVRLDASMDQWSAPSLLGRSIPGFPDVLRLRSDGAGHAVAAWGVSQGLGGPYLQIADSSGMWQSGPALDRDGAGFAPELSSFAADDFVVSWSQVAPQGLYDIVVQRVR